MVSGFFTVWPDGARPSRDSPFKFSGLQFWRWICAPTTQTLPNAVNLMLAIKVLRRLAAAALVLATAGYAQAGVIYQFNSTAVGAFGAGPYGTVTLDQAGADVDVTVALRADLNFVNTGGPHSVFSFNAAGVVAADISNILFNGIARPEFTIVSPGMNQPFGTNFNLSVDCTGTVCRNGAPGQTADPLTFRIANANAVTDFGFLVTGTTASFASDVICTTGSCAGATGAIGVEKLPEPGVLVLLAAGLLGAAAARRRSAR